MDRADVPQDVPMAQSTDALDAFRDVQAMVAKAAEEKAWAMKRDWTDEDFQRGAEANASKLQEFEDALVAKLKRSVAASVNKACPGHGGATEATSEASSPDVDRDNVLSHVLGNGSLVGAVDANTRAEVLRDPEILGSSLDIVGAYLKNYEVDKAGAVMETIMPFCREKGFYWVLKSLNHMATVRMKQSRPADALKCLEEIETLAAARLTVEQRDEAWEFWETTYRNFGWIMSSLGRHDEAIEYIKKAVEVKERVGMTASWFDLWDLGRMMATTAFKSNEPDKIVECQGIVTRSVWLHSEAEPNDLVMRAKIWHTVGDCSFALGHMADKKLADGVADDLDANPHGPSLSPEAKTHYQQALYAYRESHALFDKTEGRLNHLTGSAAEATAWVLLKLGEDQEAKEFLLIALEAASLQQNGWGDGVESDAPALQNVVRVVDQILEVHRRTDDRLGLPRYFTALETLCANVTARLGPLGVGGAGAARTDANLQEALVSSCSLLIVAAGEKDRARRLVQMYMGEAPTTQRAQLCRAMLLSLPSGQKPDLVGLLGEAANSPEASQLLDQLQRLAPGARSARSAVAARQQRGRATCLFTGGFTVSGLLSRALKRPSQETARGRRPRVGTSALLAQTMSRPAPQVVLPQLSWGRTHLHIA